MDTEERPQKLRKLETPPDSEPAVPLLPQPVENVPSAPENSKPQEHAANDAGAIVVNSEDGSDMEFDAGISSEVQDPPSQNGDNAQPMSKNQLKKLRKREAWDAGRDYRKAKRKQKIQERKQRKRDAKEEEQARQQENGGASESATTPRPYRRSVLLPITIMIDCGFDDLMIEKERISLGSQLTRSYSDNWRAPFQTHLVISSWGGLLGERFDTVLRKYHLNWKGVTFETDGFVEAAQKAHEFMKGPKGGKLAGIFQPVASEFAEAKEKESKEVVKQPQPSNGSTSQPSTTPNAMDVSFILSAPSPEPEPAKQQHQEPALPPPSQTSIPTTPSPDSGEIIYLSSDSPDTLSTLRPYSTYIVGGLVDKNRHKGICYRTACEQGIKTAKLPIGEYLNMQSRKVLTTNHVVEIMIRYLECGDWGEAFLKVIPKRKGGKLRDKSADEGLKDGPDNGDGDDDDDDVEDDAEDNDGGFEKDNDTLEGGQEPNITGADDGGVVDSSHVEDLPSSNAEVPAIL